MQLKIYNQSNALKAIVNTSPSSVLNQELMVEDVVSASWTDMECVVLDVNDYILMEGVRYKIKKEYKPAQKSNQEYSYSVKFYGPIHDSQQIMFLNLTDGQYESEFSLNGGPREHLQKWIDNMNRVSDAVWSIGTVVSSPNKTIEYNKMFCWDAGNSIAEAFDTEIWTDGNVINLCRCEHGEQVSLGYGKGLTSLIQNENSSNTRFFTRLIPLGSMRNIDPARYGAKRLQLPDKRKYVDRNTHYGLFEHIEEAAFAGIYPHYVGTVSSVRVEDRRGKDGKPFKVYYFKDSGMDFDPNEYEIGNLVKRISFQSGDLNGQGESDNGKNYWFEANYHSGTKEWEIINIYPSEGNQIPGNNLIPRVGDKYIPWNFRMPDAYEKQAEKDYEEAVRNFLARYSDDISVYNLNTDYIYISEHAVSLKVGQRVRLESKEYFGSAGYRDSRMTKVTRKLDNLDMAAISCTSQVSKGWKKGVDNSIEHLKYVVARQQEETAIDILKSWDEREPNDYRVFSALRILKELDHRSLSRLSDDTAEGLITFLKGLTSAERARLLKGFEAGVFNQGLSGALIDEQGDAELRNLIVRLKAVVSVLEVKGNTKTDSLSATNDVTGKRVTASEKVSAPLVQGTQVKGTAVEATENVSGKNVLAQEGVAGKNVTATRKVKGADVEATETVKGKNVQAQEAVSGKRAELSERVTTLNLLVRALAEMHNLTVSDTARLLKGIIRESLSSPEFVSGFAGNGFKLYKDAVTGDWNMEIDNIVVRKLFNVFEIRVQRITHQGGMVIRSAAGGKITKVTDMGSYWKCEHDGLDDFVANDQVLSQAFKFIGEGGKIKRYWRLATEAGKGYVCLSKSDCEQSSSVPEKDDEIVLLGNRKNKARQSAQIDCVIGNDAPYRDTYDGINSFSLAGKLISREGNLTGIVDPDFGSLNGYGLYTKNLFAKGHLRLTNGKTVETAISEGIKASKGHADAEITKVRTDFNIIEGQINAKVQEVTTKTQQAAAAAQTATEKASQASGSATVAGQKATAAGNSAKAAKTSETNAGNILQEVTAKESNINVTAGQIATKVSEVNQKAVEVSTNAGNADKSAKAAKTSETNAGASAATATQKAQAAASSAGTASAKAGEAATSATNAGKSATTAASEAGKARNSADAAKASADAASAKLVTITEKESSINQTAGQISTQVTEATKQAGIASQKAAAASGSAATAQSEANKAKGSADSASASLQTISSKQTQINQTATEIEAKATRAERAAGKAESAEASVRVKAGEVTVKAQEVVNKAAEAGNSAQSAKNAAELSMAMSKGKMLYRDPTFKEGFNGTHTYNNKPSGQVKLERVGTGERNPTTSTHMLRITTSGSDTSPGFGGFFFNTSTKANRVLVTRIIAKIPVGRIITFATNAVGGDPVKKWLTPQVGTGKWEEYAFKLVCGTGGAFDTTNYFYIYGGNAPTPESPLVWYVAYATVFDVTDAEIDYIADAAAKYTTKTEYNAKIELLTNQISSKVSKTDFNALNQRVGSAESALTQHASLIEARVTKTDFGTLTGRVTTAESKIAATESSIAATVSRVDGLTGRMSQAEQKITPDAIRLTVKSQTQEIVNKSISIAVPKVEKKIDLRGDGFDQNKYYPVTFHSFRHDRRYRIKVARPLYSSYGVPAWSSHISGSYLYAEWENNGSGWGSAGIDTKRVITKYDQRHTKSSDPILGDIGQVYQISREYFYVRGGSLYDVIVEGPNDEIEIELHQEEYVWQSTNGAYSSRLPIKDSVVAPSITYTLDTVFTTEVKQLKDSIALRATKEEVNSLGTTVSSHTAAINVLPTTIDNRITSQTNDGGIIKTKVESWFRMEGDKVYLGGKVVNISGATVFGSLASKTDAQGYANSARAAAISTAASDATGKANNAKSAAISAAASDATTKANNAKAAAISAAASDATTKANNALNGAKGYTDQLKGTLKGMAYQDMVTLAKLDNTIIEGGFLKTSLIKAGSIIADKLASNSITAEKINVNSLRAAILTAEAVNALDITARKISAANGTFDRIEGTSGEDSMLLTPDIIRFKNSHTSVFIGADTMPASAGGQMVTPMRIHVNRVMSSYYSGTNAGLFLSIKGAKQYDDYVSSGNHALYIEGGDICGVRLRARRINRNTTLSTMDSIIFIVTPGITVTLPSSGVEDGQIYFIRNLCNGSCTVAGYNIAAWGDGGRGNRFQLNRANFAFMMYDKHNNIWTANWIGNW